MDGKNSVLGKGLSAIFNEKNVDLSGIEQNAGKLVSEIELSKIQINPQQPREDFDEERLNELADSIKQNGLIQPVTVKESSSGLFVLISGERRLRAAKILGLEKIPAYIYGHPETNESMLELALIENIQRENLNPMELSDSFLRLMDEYNLTQEQISEKVSKQRSTVGNYLRLQKLTSEVKASLRKNEITEAHARLLLRIENPEEQVVLLEKVIRDNITVKNLEELTKTNTKKPRTKKINLGEIYDPYLQKLEDKLRNYFGTKVTIKRKTKFSGEIIVDYFSNDDLERIIEKCDR